MTVLYSKSSRGCCLMWQKKTKSSLWPTSPYIICPHFSLTTSPPSVHSSPCLRAFELAVCSSCNILPPIPLLDPIWASIQMPQEVCSDRLL